MSSTSLRASTSPCRTCASAAATSPASTPANARGGNIRATTGTKLKLANVDVTGGDAFVGGGVYVELDRANLDLEGPVRVQRRDRRWRQSRRSGNCQGRRSSETTFQLSDVISSTETAPTGGGRSTASGGGLKLIDSIVQGSSVETTGAGNAAFGAGVYSGGAADDTWLDDSREHRQRRRRQHRRARRRHLLLGRHGPDRQQHLLRQPGGRSRRQRRHRRGDLRRPAQVEVKHVTFDSNQGSDEGDTLQRPAATWTSVRLDHRRRHRPVSGASVASSGLNVSESIDANCDFDRTDVVGGDPGLGSIADNGGPTPTIAIAPTSDAKNLRAEGQVQAGDEEPRPARLQAAEGPGLRLRRVRARGEQSVPVDRVRRLWR